MNTKNFEAKANINKMSIEECIFTRRTVRQYDSSIEIDDEMIKQLIKAAIYAPSACNFQAWKFIIVEDDELKRAIIQNNGSKIILNSQKGILVMYRNDIEVQGKKHKDYVQSAAAGIQNILLMAYSKGIGTCWICDLPKSRVLRKIFQIPSNYDIIAYITLGHPRKQQENNEKQKIYHYGDSESYDLHKRKYSIEQVMSKNYFQFIEGDSTQKNYPKKTISIRIKKIFSFMFKKIKITLS